MSKIKDTVVNVTIIAGLIFLIFLMVSLCKIGHDYVVSFSRQRLEYAAKIYQSEDTLKETRELIKEYLLDGEITDKEEFILRVLVEK